MILLKKALIWIGCMILGSILLTVFSLKPSPLILIGTILVATYLCKKLG